MTPKISRRYADTPFGQVHYRSAGTGEPLVLLHQVAASSAAYEGMMAHLAPSHHVFALDLPGFGASDAPPKVYGVADYAVHLAAALESLGIGQAALYGHHSGAAIAVEIAAVEPQRVDKLILNGVPYFEMDFESFSKNNPALYGPIVFKEDGSHLTSVWNTIEELARKAFSPPYDASTLAIIHSEVMAKLTAADSHIDAYRAVFAYDILDRLPLVKAPTFLLVGDEDSLAQNNKLVASKLGRVRTKMVPGGSYFSAYTDHARLSQEILAFLANPQV